MKKIINFWMAALTLAGFSVLVFWSCNVSETGEVNILQMQLDDSLSVEANVFDSIDIDLFDGEGNLTHANVFHGPYHKADADKLANLALNSKVPDPVEIRITAYKDTNDFWVFKIKIANGTREVLPPSHTGPSTPPVLNPGDTLAPTRLVITSPATPILYVGDPTISLLATAEPAKAIQTVTWSLSPGDVAVLEAGDKLKALKPGTVTLKATSTRSPAVSTTLELTVKNATSVLPTSVHIENASPLLLTVDGPSVTLQASVLPTDAKQETKWTLPANTVAALEAGNKIKGLKSGSVTVTASSTVVPSLFDTLIVTVQDPPTVLPNLITLKSPSLTLLVGAPPVGLEATVSPAEASQNLIWTFDAPGVVEIVNNNQIKGLKSGTAKVTATSAVKSSVTAVLDVKVEAPVIVPDSLSLRMPTPMVLALGGTDGDLLWTVFPAGADQGVEWSSSDITVAQITEDNKVRPMKKGAAKITGKSKAKSTVTAVFDVSVIVPVKVDAINILPKTLTLYTGGPEGKLSVTLTGSDTGAQYTLASSDAAIATVSATGSVKGLAAGAVGITASVVGYPAITSACSVLVVKDAPVVTVGPNQNVAFNGEAVFTVSVAPQAYGSTVEIKADMDGDNVFEQTVLNKETADFKQKYTEVKSTTVSFKVKDTEGNEVTVTRKVTVGAPGAPIVSIVIPSKDTSISAPTLSFKIRFTVKDTAQKIDTFVDSTVSLIAGSNKIRAARKNVGGEGSDEVAILVDNTAPNVAIAGAATQTTGVAAFSLAGTASDVGAGLQAVSVSGALSGNGAATLASGDWSKGGLTLKEGANTIVATATDKVGNTKTASITVTLDSKKPGVPTVSAPAAVRAGPIKWTWTKANADGSGKFKVKINGGPEIDAAIAEYSLATLTDGTTYGLAVKETDPLAGDGAWSAEKKVLYDSKKPNPSITVTATPTRTPEWKWAGNGGIGTYRWHYKGQAAGSAGTGVTTSFAPTNLGTGSHTLCVQEKDSPEWGDEWGTENCALVEVDKTGPTITDIQFPDGYVTNQTSITISFKADLAAKSYVCQLAKDDAENVCTLSANDALGNPATVERKIWRRSNVVFVRVGATGTGASFDNAYGSLWQAIKNLQSNQTQIWMMEGDYNIDEVIAPFMRSGTSIYGGFSSDKNQGSVADRNLNSDKTLLNTKGTIPDGGSAREVLQIKTESGTLISDITLDGLKFKPGYYGLFISEADNVKINNCVFSSTGAAGLILMDNAAVTFNDCRFEENTSSDMLNISGKTVTFNRCTFRNNYSSFGAFVLSQGKVIVNNSTFQNSPGFTGVEPNRWIMVYTDTSYPNLDMYNCTIQGFGDDPGPIVTNNFEKFTIGGTGNHAP